MDVEDRRKVECGQVVMDVAYSSHNREWQVVQEPTKEANLADEEELMKVCWTQVGIASLHSSQVAKEGQDVGNDGNGAAPPDDGVADEVVLGGIVGPRVHPQTVPEEWPVPRLGSQDVFLVVIGNQGIVARHHGHIEVDEVSQKGRLVKFCIACR